MTDPEMDNYTSGLVDAALAGGGQLCILKIIAELARALVGVKPPDWVVPKLECALMALDIYAERARLLRGDTEGSA